MAKIQSNDRFGFIEDCAPDSFRGAINYSLHCEESGKVVQGNNDTR